MIDEVDAKIVMLLQEDGRLSNAAIAEEVGLTTSTVFDRIKKLEKRGVIKKYVAVVDPETVGKSITAFIRLVVGVTGNAEYASCKQAFAEACVAEPAVLECHTIAGDDCYMLKVRVGSPQELEQLLEKLRSYAHVTKSTTNIVLSTFKEESTISTS